MRLKYRLNCALLGLIACVSLSGNVRADLIVVVGDWTTPLGSGVIPTFNAGSSATIPVYAYTDQVGTNTLSSYVLTFDFGTAGKGFSSFFSNFTADFSSAALAVSPSLQEDSAAVNYDFKVSASAVSPVLVPMNATSPATAIKLFDLQFDIAASGSGTHDFVVAPLGVDQAPIPGLPPQNPNQLNGTGFPISNSYLAISPAGGTFNISAVPEPTSLGLVGVTLAAAALRRRRTQS